MKTVPDTELKLRHLTVDYSSGHVLIDGRSIGCFVAEQGPEILRSPAENCYIINVPLMVESVTFLPSGDSFENKTTLIDSWNLIKSAFQGAIGTAEKTYTESEVRIALNQVFFASGEVDHVMGLLGEEES